jgi:hypothetical protein
MKPDKKAGESIPLHILSAYRTDATEQEQEQEKERKLFRSAGQMRRRTIKRKTRRRTTTFPHKSVPSLICARTGTFFSK